MGMTYNKTTNTVLIQHALGVVVIEQFFPLNMELSDDAIIEAAISYYFDFDVDITMEDYKVFVNKSFEECKSL
jgi:hypothetical protein